MNITDLSILYVGNLENRQCIKYVFVHILQIYIQACTKRLKLIKNDLKNTINKSKYEYFY